METVNLNQIMIALLQGVNHTCCYGDRKQNMILQSLFMLENDFISKVLSFIITKEFINYCVNDEIRNVLLVSLLSRIKGGNSAS